MLYSICIWKTGTVKVFDLIGNIISRVSTTDRYESKIVSMYICKGGALNRGLKLIKQLINVFECILEVHVRQRVENDEMQCRFMPGHGGTTVAIFILIQLLTSSSLSLT